MSETIETQLLVLGGGPGGYAAAIRAGQAGVDTVLVDAEGLGGTCLNRGCIPSKALLHVAHEAAVVRAAASGSHLGVAVAGEVSVDLAQAVAWKDGVVGRLTGGVAGLLKKAKVRVVAGWGIFTDAKTCTVATEEGEVTIRAEQVILAAGSEAVALPGLPFGGAVISSTEALALTELPRRLLVIGGGYIGLELGTAFRKLGSEVTVVEAADRILPQYDDALTIPVRKRLEALGVTLHLGAKALGHEKGDEGVSVTVQMKDGRSDVLTADKVLVTVGRRPRTSGWGLEAMAVDMAGPFVKVDGAGRTSTRGVWAIGDLVGEPMLAHKATAQADVAVEGVCGRPREVDGRFVPAVCFTDPEVVTVGAAPSGAEGEVVANFPFAAIGRALSTDDPDGFVRVVARQDNGLILGVQAVGAQVSELAGQFALALEMGATLEDVGEVIQAHPTRSEAFLEAGLRALGRPLHL